MFYLNCIYTPQVSKGIIIFNIFNSIGPAGEETVFEMCCIIRPFPFTRTLLQPSYSKLFTRDQDI